MKDEDCITVRDLRASVINDTMTDAEVEKLQGRLAGLVSREFERMMLRALGFVPRFPTTIQLQKRSCNCVIIHRCGRRLEGG